MIPVPSNECCTNRSDIPLVDDDDDDDLIITWSVDLDDDDDKHDTENGNTNCNYYYKGSLIKEPDNFNDESDDFTRHPDEKSTMPYSTRFNQEMESETHLPRFYSTNRFVESATLPRIGSYYFSVRSSSEAGSVSDLLAFLDESMQATAPTTTTTEDGDIIKEPTGDCSKSTNVLRVSTQQQQSDHVEKEVPDTNMSGVKINSTIKVSNAAATTIHHDLLMHILSYLDLESLASFSETGRRPNGECFYYLQLQLHQALEQPSNMKSLQSNLPGLNYVRRLATIDQRTAETTVRTLYHNILRQRTTDHRTLAENKAAAAAAAKLTAAAGSAFVVACMGMAAAAMAQQTSSSSTATSSSPFSSPMFTSMEEYDEYAAALSSIMKVMGLFGSLAAAKTMASSTATTTTATTGVTPNGPGRNNNHAMNDISNMFHPLERLMENLTMPSNNNNNPDSSNTMFAVVPRQFRYALNLAYSIASDKLKHKFPNTMTTTENGQRGGATPNFIPLLTDSSPLPWNDLYERPDPYENNASNSNTESGAIFENVQRRDGTIPSSPVDQNQISIPSTKSQKESYQSSYYVGCIGAYRHTIHMVKEKIISMVKEQRVERFNALPEDEKQEVINALMTSVIANDKARVQELIHIVNIDDSYAVGDHVNNNIMYPLHAAAFHGADQVLEFLCQGIANPILTSDVDGGLITNINQQDLTGWTALHFAAGANSVPAIRILLANHADPSIEADNGYTPYQWARRLQHHEVVEEFQTYFAQQQHDHFTQLRQFLLASYYGRPRV